MKQEFDINKIHMRPSNLKDLFAKSRKKATDGNKSGIIGIKENICLQTLSQEMRDYKYSIFQTKAMQKGILNEEEAISFAKIFTGEKELTYITNLPNGDPLKNVRKGWLQGTADAVTSTAIIDIKTAYNWHSFDMTTEQDLLDAYEWQMRAYMHLYDKQVAYIFYILSETPFEIIEKEQQSLFYKNTDKYNDQEDDNFIEDCKEMGKIFDVSDTFIGDRVKVVKIERDLDIEAEMLHWIDEAINKMKMMYQDIEVRNNNNMAIFMKNFNK